MSGPQLFPYLNGIAPSWADIQVTISPALPVGGVGAAAAAAGAASAAASVAAASGLLTTNMLQAINTGVQVASDDMRGASGGRVLADTTGEETSTCSLVFYLPGFQNFLRNLSLVAPFRRGQRAVSLVVFNIDYQYRVPNSLDMFGTRIKGARYMGREKNDAQGTAATLVTATIKAKQIVDVVNGVEAALL